MPLPYPTSVGLLLASAFLLAGLLTGAWKYLEMRHSEEAVAPVYVDIAHRAALMYAFALTLLTLLTLRTTLPETLQLALLGVLAASFAFAVASYVVHGLLRDTDNQFRKPFVLGRHRLHGATADVIMLLKGSAELFATGWLMLGFWQTLVM
ncbi:MAG: hypothetical protein ABL901_19290 [Hyphomicrobiaceae bacterium]